MRLRASTSFGAIAALLAWAGTAQANPVMSLSVGGTVFSGASGQVTDTVTSGVFKGSSFTASGFPFAGTVHEPQLDLQGLVKTSGAGTLVVKITQTENETLFPGLNFDSEFSDTLKTAGLTITYDTYFDNTDSAFGKGAHLASGTFASTGSLSDCDSESVDSPFSVTEIITLKATKRSALVTSFDASLSAIPEPATLPLLGAGMLGVGALLRRKRRS